MNFERACERENHARDSWPARLMTVLPCEAADSIARLSAEHAKCYDKVKQCLLKRFRLSAEAFRLRFRNGEDRDVSSYAERGYEIKANLREWMKSAEAFGDPDKMLEVIALEQFFIELPDQVRSWVRDKSGVVTVEAAADLADEYISLRGMEVKGGKSSAKQSKQFSLGARKHETKNHPEETSNGSTKGNAQIEGARRREWRDEKGRAKAFEKSNQLCVIGAEKRGILLLDAENHALLLHMIPRVVRRKMN